MVVLAIAAGLAGLAYSSSLNSATYHVMNGLVSPSPTAIREPRFRVSLIIPSYCESDYIGRLLQSAHNQIEPFLEMIIADCSPPLDMTPTIARAYGAVVYPTPYGNIAASRNMGASHATGDILVFTDADCILAQDFLYRAVNMLTRGKALVHPKEVIYDSYGWNYFLWGSQVMRSPSNTTRCVAVWRDAYRAVGGYDEMCNPMESGRCREDLGFGQRIAAKYGKKSLGVLPALIGTSARRYKKQGLAGLKHFDVPVRSRVRSVTGR